jgi:hypothetical protein
MKRSDSIVMILKNSHSSAQIPLSLGDNDVYTEMFPDFCKNNLLMFNINVSSKENFTIRTNEHFPIKLRFLSKSDGKVMDEKVYYTQKILELSNMSEVQILHLFSKNHFFIENSDNVILYENLVESKMTANPSLKKNPKSLSEISFAHENTDISMLARDDENSKIEVNTDLNSLDQSIEEMKYSADAFEVRKNLRDEFASINTDRNILTPIKKRRQGSAKKSSEKLTMQENLPLKDQSINEPSKPTENVIFPKRRLIIDDDETPVKNFSTPVKAKSDSSPYLRSKRKRSEDISSKCPICLEKIKDSSKLDICQHQFCSECIDQWSNLSNTCPVCKEEFKKIIYLHDDKTIEKKVKRRKFQPEEEEEESWLQNCAEDCMVCGKSDNQHLLLVCDKCQFNICHVDCAGLEMIPDEDWVCSECSKKRRKRKNYTSSPNVNTRSRIKLGGYSLRSKRK